MKPFKFLNCPILKSHDGHDIYAGEWFYSVNKEEFTSISGRPIPKYTVVPRRVSHSFKDKFRPDHEKLWYFKSRNNAEWLINIWKRQDARMGGGESMFHQSDIVVTFPRQTN